MTVDVCPACGYPTIGPDVCFFCRPEIVMTGQQTSEPDVSTTLHRGSVPVGVMHPGLDPAAHVG
ncbi:hypothetical protein [Mycobacterium noviomagense]|uniref:Uncharacterized protein n=1 Tax=Mycobacterium noviomagense TaxID=459858 RepID=A0A7I7PC80_9MYCO|nr:hypothetical protein [Mycobacterium noviomagense]BBY06146.1 hypothetical protein MNVI_14640 [Mycobacterium noviomagense]